MPILQEQKSTTPSGFLRTKNLSNFCTSAVLIRGAHITEITRFTLALGGIFPVKVSLFLADSCVTIIIKLRLENLKDIF